ncbi:MAG: hypothetical protein APF81_06860 [Desulfosporosinus sp. BRH_c37]|nr:MAG: hypothetical protein APF81_06860 [Desulfosporosinus sp. BRH_c37]
MFDKVFKNSFNFFELKEKPSEEELKNYYKNKYYQENNGPYTIQYSDDEVTWFNNMLNRRYAIINNIMGNKEAGMRFLDVGCGEGWALGFFKRKKWEVLGLDFSDYGCKSHNPDCLSHLRVGNIYDTLTSLVIEKEKFDVIWLDNVLEHVLDPLSLLQVCKGLIKAQGVLVIEVPNDFSPLQQLLYNKGIVSKPFWVLIPDHINYFNCEGLDAICRSTGWETRFLMSDFPIDLNLFNPNTNYVNEPTRGKSCHQARIDIENFLSLISETKLNNLYEVIADMGLGRSIVSFLQVVNP